MDDFKEKNMTNNTTANSGYQILVVNIKYGKELGGKVKSRPNMSVLDVPSGVLKNIKNKEKFMDSVESFAYNTLTKKYSAEVNYCQVWLPLND